MSRCLDEKIIKSAMSYFVSYRSFTGRQARELCNHCAIGPVDRSSIGLFFGSFLKVKFRTAQQGDLFDYSETSL